MPYLIYKNLGETPLEALEHFRAEKNTAGENYEGKNFSSLPLTYAGRLDPMAEGLLLVLAGEECKQKGKYLGLDKVYETEILLGVSSDTHDLLGLVPADLDRAAERGLKISKEKIETKLKKFLGRRSQTYPAFSSKTHNGLALFVRARAGGPVTSGGLPDADEMPKREVEIYQIDWLGEKYLVAGNLEKEIIRRIALVTGDFRQKAIVARWQDFFAKNPGSIFQIFSIRVHCSSATYIRVLAHELGQKLGTGALAFSIKRTQIGEKTLDDLVS